jgi:hypothetical protein
LRAVPGCNRHGATPAAEFRHNDQSRALFVVTRKIVKALFLGEDVRLRRLFVSREAPKNYRAIDLRRKFGSALSINAIGFALAMLLSGRLGFGANQEQET